MASKKCKFVFLYHRASSNGPLVADLRVPGMVLTAATFEAKQEPPQSGLKIIQQTINLPLILHIINYTVPTFCNCHVVHILFVLITYN